jgi:hemerythrin
MIMAIGFNSCQKDNPEKFTEDEKIKIHFEIENILTKLGYSDFSIHINYHKNYNYREISKSVSTVKIFGDEIPVEIIDYSPYQNQYMQTDKRGYIHNGYVENRNYIVNYVDINSEEIVYEYISILIIIDNIEQKKINELLKLFSNYLLNNNRGDTIYIMSK